MTKEADTANGSVIETQLEQNDKEIAALLASGVTPDCEGFFPMARSVRFQGVALRAMIGKVDKVSTAVEGVPDEIMSRLHAKDIAKEAKVATEDESQDKGSGFTVRNPLTGAVLIEATNVPAFAMRNLSRFAVAAMVVYIILAIEGKIPWHDHSSHDSAETTDTRIELEQPISMLRGGH